MSARLHEFLRFALVGFVGFVVDAGLLELAVFLGLPAQSARVISILLALQVTYTLHGRFTFRRHGGYSRRAWLQFMLANLIGALLNYGTFLLLLIDDTRPTRLVALLGGTGVGLCFNYWANRKFAFRAPKESP